jgi:hypothetical protein
LNVIFEGCNFPEYDFSRVLDQLFLLGKDAHFIPPLSFFCWFLDNCYFFARQAVEFMDKLVDLAVGGLDLALKTGFSLWVVRG